MKKETIRAIVLFGVTVVVLGAYVIHRRSAIQSQGTTAATTPGDDGPGFEDGGPGPGEGGPGGGPGGPGEGPGGPGEGPGGPSPEMGVEPGQPDPQGLPGEHGPRSHSICIKPTRGGSYHYQLSGKVTIHDPDPTKRRAVTTVMAVDKPVEQWSEVQTIKVYESLTTTSDRWQMDFRARAETVHLCAIQTGDYQEFTYVHVAGCVAQSVAARKGGAPAVETDLDVPIRTLSTIAELIGFARLVPRHVWPGTTRRHLKGRAVSPAAPDGRFLIATAPIPILEQAEDSEGNPNGLDVTGPDGRFDITLLAKPGVPQYVCALGLPPKGMEIRTLTHLTGKGCVKVQVPEATGGEVTMESIRVQVDPNVKVEMTAHEKEHFTFLDECLSD